MKLKDLVEDFSKKFTLHTSINELIYLISNLFNFFLMNLVLISLTIFFKVNLVQFVIKFRKQNNIKRFLILQFCIFLSRTNYTIFIFHQITRVI